MKIFAEAFPVGRKFFSQGRTIDEGDFTLLNNLTWNNERFTADAEYMKKAQFGERILAGPCVLAVATGLMVQNSAYSKLLYQSPLQPLVFLGIDEWRMRAPVRVGDTIRAIAEIVEVRPTSKPNKAVVKIKFEVFNQCQELVTYFTAVFLHVIQE